MMTGDSDPAHKTRETRLRRMAQRQGLVLRKSRRRDERARDYATYVVWRESTSDEASVSSAVGPFSSLDEVEAWLTDDPNTRPQNALQLSKARERAEAEAQARYAEQLTVESDPVDATVRHVVLGDHRVAKLVYSGDARWGLVYLVDGNDHDSFNDILATADETESVDRHGVGWAADALASGKLREPGGQG